MLEKPDISEPLMTACLLDHYGLAAARIVFLPIGNDENTAVFRLVADDGAPYFLKVRRGDFDETSATLPKFLSDQGIKQIIAPIETMQQQLWASFSRYKLMLYPFVEGRTGFDTELSDRNWIDLGRALRAIHEATLPPAIKRQLRKETYSSLWRNIVRTLLESEIRPVDAATERLSIFVRTRREEIVGLVDRAQELAPAAQNNASALVLCHGDIHGRNVLIDSSGVLHIVDWDTAVLAPKERDLMFIGGGVGGIWNDEREAALFYEGYGPANVAGAVLAYYRYDRIVEDIAVTSRQILSKDFGDQDREKWAWQLERQFLPGNVVEMARLAYERLSPP
jgi:spectinomycin phosphotransferase